MAENAQLADDEKTLRTNIAAEKHAAQIAAANDNSTFYDEYVEIKNGYLRYWYVCIAIGTEGPCMNAILPKLFQRKFDPSASKYKFNCTVCNAIYEREWGVFVEMQINGQIHCFRSTVPDDDTLYIQSMYRERKHKDTSIAQALYNEISMIAPKKTHYVLCVDSVKGQYRMNSATWYMWLPRRRWSEVLRSSFA